jgi:hypothetical protein
MLGRLELQREILAAIDDPDKLRGIAVREGIDPQLWDYWISMTEIVHNMNEEMKRVLAEAGEEPSV